MDKQTPLTAAELTTRNAMLADAVAKYGVTTVSRWADDPAKVRIINALAAMVTR